MFRGIERGCFESNFDLLIHSTHLSTADPNSHLPVGEHNTDGLLVFLNSLSDAEINRLHHKGFPLVLLHRSPPQPHSIPHVLFENKGGARKITDHLIEVHACQRIAFLAGPKGNEDSHWRDLGYRESLADHGLQVNPDLIRLGGFSEEIAQSTVEAWLAEGFQADAIFAADDDSAYTALRALHQAGIQVPEEVAVVGKRRGRAGQTIT